MTGQIGYIVQMKRPGDLAMREEKDIQERILAGRSDGLVAVMPEDIREWRRASEERRVPAHYLYAEAYGGPGSKVPHTTIRIEYAKVWMLPRFAKAAADRYGGTVRKVEIVMDPLHERLQAGAFADVPY